MTPAVTESARETSARERLLLAAAQLMDAAQGAEVSTRAICERAGVQAPTLYHHFGSKQGLQDAVITHGFKQFLAERAAGADGANTDPIRDIRDAWDLHVSYGLENPSFYTLIYGRAVPGQPCGVVSEVEAMILEALRPVARARRLRVAPERAAREILAASTGVVLTLIAQPCGEVDLSLSDDVRDAILERITTTPRRAVTDDGAPLASAAIALDTALAEDPAPLSEGEATLLREWLRRLGAS
jgi:AcrR family transcriptional regulator